MKIQRAYRTKLDPTKEQAGYFLGCAGAARFVYNWALADRRATFEAGGKPNKFEQKKRFNAIKKELSPWLADYPYVISQEAFDHLDAAYQNFFRRVKQGTEKAGFPKFKSRHKSKMSFSLRGVTIEGSRVKLPVIGWVKLAERDYLPTSDVKINTATISETAGNWFISVQVEMEIDDPVVPTGQAIGVDLGIKSLAVVSDGMTFDNPKTLTKYEKQLSRLQRELHRRVKGSSNRAKTKAKIAKLHAKITNTRKHSLHNISRHVTAKTKPIAVVVEDLNVKGMLKNGKLSKAISDASFGELRRQIEYKAQWNGVNVVVANQWFASSKTCSSCGYVNRELTLADRAWTCPTCGTNLDRDLNAAVNLANLA